MPAPIVGWIVVVFGDLVIAGGVIAYATKGSVLSLATALPCGLLLTLFGLLIRRGHRAGKPGAMAVCGALALFFAYHLADTGKVMPALPIMVLSLSTALTVWRATNAPG